MDRRRETRFQTNTQARITILGQNAPVLAGVVVSVSSGGMRLSVSGPVPQNAAIKIEWADGLALGEVCWCRPEAQGLSIGVRLEHSLGCLGELEELARRLLGDPSVQEAGKPANPA